MQRATVVFLVILRLAIGWHFLFEGLHKIHTTRAGETATSRPFSSAGFFREARGPLSPLFRSAVGDPDDEALGRLVVKPLGEGDSDDKPHQRMPPLLEKEWHDYADRFAAHYGLTDEQRGQADGKLVQAESAVVTWLTETTVNDKTKEMVRRFPGGEVKVKVPTAQRINEYRAKVADLRETLSRKLPAFGSDVEGARLRQTKAGVAELRDGLLKDLAEYTKKFKESLDSVLTPEQRQKGAVPEPAVGQKRTVEWIDWATRWGLTAIGALLLVGLLTRLSCVAGAAFLLTTYLIAPPWPWMPAAPQSEGYYLFVNKNLIEMLALLVLATTPSGRWFGLDRLIHAAWTAAFGKREPAPVRVPPPPREAVVESAF
jgi:uncharacterized membrane protein YphA (DoxX/SURF4 family)